MKKKYWRNAVTGIACYNGEPVDFVALWNEHLQVRAVWLMQSSLADFG